MNSHAYRLYRASFMLLLRVICGGFLLLLLGCMKPYTSSVITSIPLAQHFSTTLNEHSTLPLDSNQSFSDALLSLMDDENLRTLLHLALANNTNLLTLTSQIAQARQALGLAHASLLPTLSFNAGYNASSGNYNRYQISSYQNTASSNLSLSWELDVFGKLNMLRKSKQYEYLASESNLSVAQVSLLSEVASDYYAFKHGDSALKTYAHIIYNDEQILSTLQQQYTLGLVDINIINDAFSTLSNAKNTYNSLILEQEKRKNALALLLNTSDMDMLNSLLDSSKSSTSLNDTHMPSTSTLQAPHTASTQPLTSSTTQAQHPEKQAPTSLATSLEKLPLQSPLPSIMLPAINLLPSEVLLLRDDVRSSIASLNAQVMLKNAKKAALFPSITLGGNLGQILFSASGISDMVWNITSALTAPILNRSTLTKDYLIQQENLKQAMYALESTLRTALSEIENALTEVNTASSSLASNEQMLTHAKEVWEATSQRYALGLVDEVSYLTSQNIMLNALKSVEEARLARISSAIILYKALGGHLANKPINNANLDSAPSMPSSATPPTSHNTSTPLPSSHHAYLKAIITPHAT